MEIEHLATLSNRKVNEDIGKLIPDIITFEWDDFKYEVQETMQKHWQKTRRQKERFDQESH